MMSQSPELRTNVYVDGFNHYHGCFGGRGNRAEWRKYRWLDLLTWIKKQFPRNDINRIRYFTALVDPHTSNPDNRNRQLTYIRALETTPLLTVHHGRFATMRKSRLLADPDYRTATPMVPWQHVQVIESEEKGSDVNLASYLLLDGFRNEYDIAIVISNDSDLATPIKLTRNELGKRVGLLNPRKSVAFDLQGIADFYRSVRLGPLQSSQFPETMTDAHGTITKPATW
jgi:uncharacterized LabA/DUF88 family protein